MTSFMDRHPGEYTISRQARWHQEGRLVVEVTHGGIDFAGPDALCKKYTGEFEPVIGLEPALEIAIRIARLWKVDQPDKAIYLDVVDNGGGLVSMDGGVLTTDEIGLSKLLDDAQKLDEALPRCECGAFLPALRDRYYVTGLDEQFCSKPCADQAAAVLLGEP